jgi:cell division protein FtsW
MKKIKAILNNFFMEIYGALWCIDRATLGILLLLVSISSFELISSLHITEIRISKNIFLFKKHMTFIGIFFLGIFVLSNFSVENNIMFCGLVGMGAIFLCVLTLIIGVSINGSKRWINLIFISLQPSVFLKNTLGVFFPFLFKKVKYNILFISFCCLIVLFQPDFGMCLLLFAIAMTELFLMYDKELLEYAYLLLIALGAFGVFIFFKGNYFITRISRFFSPEGLYQSNIALYNIKNTSLFGRDNVPTIPDAPTDFIFASIISHYGIFTGIVIVILFVLFFIRNIQHASGFSDKKRVMIYGILVQIAYQSIFHFASNLNFIPPKGVSCPFLSFGGSELLASIFSIGTLLSATKRKIDINK